MARQRRFFRIPPLLGVMVAACLVPVIHAQYATQTLHAQPAPARDYQLFVGIDITADFEGENVVIENYVKGKAVIANGERQGLPLNRFRSMRYDYEPKISRAAATIANLKAEQTYAQGANPHAQWAKRYMDYASHQADQMGRAAGAITNAGIGRIMAGIDPTTPLGQVAEASGASMGQLASDLDSASMAAADIDHTYFASRPNAEAGESAFNSLAVTFWASSPEPVADTYAVGIVRVSDQGNIIDTLFFHDIGRLDATPRLVRAKKDGLPNGFELQHVTIHLFSHGQELPTNLSEKRFDVTRDEAREYLVLNHAASNRFAILPPQPAWSLAPSPLRAADNPAEFNYPVTVEVNARGEVVDFDSRQVLPRRVRDTVRDLLFLPALQNGEPVSGRTTVNLADYFQ